MKGTKPAGEGYNSPFDQPSDAELARQTARGDRTAAGMLVGRHQKPVRSFLLRLTGREDVANDLAQDTFLRALRYADRYDSRYSMRAWLLTIARRLWINHSRTQSRHNRGRQYDNIAETLAAPEPGPDELADRADDRGVTRQMLDKAMQSLTEPQRTALVLFHQQGLTLAETAEVMKMPMGTVKSHLHRGRSALREILSPKLEAMHR